jgi:integrase
MLVGTLLLLAPTSVPPSSSTPGADVVVISKRLRHSSPAITLRVYAHLFRQRG